MLPVRGHRRDRRDVDDDPAAGRALRSRRRPEAPDRGDRATHVRPQDRVDQLVVERVEVVVRDEPRDPGALTSTSQPPSSSLDLARDATERAHCRSRRRRGRGAARPGAPPRGPRSFTRAPVPDDDAEAVAGERATDGGADSARAARHDRDGRSEKRRSGRASVAAHAQVGLLLVRRRSPRARRAASSTSPIITDASSRLDPLVRAGLEELADPEPAGVAGGAPRRQRVVRADHLVAVGDVRLRPEEEGAVVASCARGTRRGSRGHHLDVLGRDLGRPRRRISSSVSQTIDLAAVAPRRARATSAVGSHCELPLDSRHASRGQLPPRS